MTDNVHMHTQSGASLRLVLLAVLAALIVGVLIAVVSPASSAAAEVRLAASGQPGHVASPGRLPTLTNDVGQPGSGPESQLPLGIGLLGLGMLGLAFGMLRLTPQRHPNRAAGYGG
jgi:hypothetical protein